MVVARKDDFDQWQRQRADVVLAEGAGDARWYASATVRRVKTKQRPQRFISLLLALYSPDPVRTRKTEHPFLWALVAIVNRADDRRKMVWFFWFSG